MSLAFGDRVPPPYSQPTPTTPPRKVERGGGGPVGHSLPRSTALRAIRVPFGSRRGGTFLGRLTTSLAISTGLAWALSRIPLVSRGVGVRRPAIARS